ncbi:MAG: N-acetylmuramoyl-L-alanine amidase [candidate division TM6 bacterium GW2011_GWF2_33_332]|nr:MAG: N-acetylmuramoyl-L-alanine amidase [candidate division TM6 bacterium GW2011_GWF2_33_332]
MITDIIDKLPRRGQYAQRSIEAIDKIVIHHSASPAGRFTMYDFANWHIDPGGRLKAPGIAYHFGIDPDGKIYQSNKLTSQSWHAGNGNPSSVGVVLNGNFENEIPSDAQKKSLKYLIRFLRRKLKKKLTVFGHREIPGNLTACPGRNLNLEEFRM